MYVGVARCRYGRAVELISSETTLHDADRSIRPPSEATGHRLEVEDTVIIDYKGCILNARS